MVYSQWRCFLCQFTAIQSQPSAGFYDIQVYRAMEHGTELMKRINYTFYWLQLFASLPEIILLLETSLIIEIKSKQPKTKFSLIIIICS